MGKYVEAARRAKRTCDQLAEAPDCLVAANQLVFEFLHEVRNMALAQSQSSQHLDLLQDNFLVQLRRAADSLRVHPLRIVDSASSQEIKGIGPVIARIIVEDLFSLYPPAPLSEEELRQQEAVRAALKAATAKPKKRKAEGTADRGAAAAAPAAPPSVLDASAVAEEDDSDAADAAGGRKKRAKRGEGGAKAPREYVPRVGSANYAFLVAQKSGARREYLGKQEVMELAEASGLADRPIAGDGNPVQARYGGNPRAFYNGWSCFNSQLVNQHGLARKWSNPLKVSLTEKGFALAERLYRDGVARGRLQPLPDLPAAGPWLFQLEPCPPPPAPPDLPAGVLPSAALQVGGAALQQQHQQHQQQTQQLQQRMPAEPRPCSRAAAGVSPAQAAAEAAARRWQQQQQQEQGQVYDYGEPAALGMVDEEEDELGLSLAARLERQRYPQQQGRREQQRHPPALRRPALQGPAAPAADIIDLASSSSDESAGMPPRQQQQQQQGQQRQQQQPLPAIEAGASGFNGRNGAVSLADGDVALMVDMGYSDRRARRALRRSLGDIGAAVELAELLGSESSDSDSDDGEGIDAAANLDAPAAAVPAAQQRVRRRASKAAAGVWRALAAASSDSDDGSSQCGQAHEFEDAEEELPSHLVLHAPRAAKRVAAAVAAPPPNASLAPLGQQDSLPWPEPASRQASEQPSQSLGRGHMAQQCQHAVQDTAASCGASQAAGPSQASTGDGGARLRVDASQLRLPPLAPGHKFAQEYEVVLVLDSREQYSRAGHANIASARAQHMAQMRGAGLAVAEAHLVVGDVAWAAVRRGAVAGDGGRLDPRSAYLLDFILERKSMPDLVSSIRDKRFVMQKYFLRRSGMAQVFYLLEGSPDLLPTPQEQKMVRTAAADTEVADGFRVLRTTGHHDTFRLYLQLTRAVTSLYAPLTANGSGARPTPTLAAFNSSLQAVNAGQLALRDVWALMLSSVPKVGPTAVAAIVAAYPTPRALWQAYLRKAAEAEARDEDGAAAAALMLRDLRGERSRSAVGPLASRAVFNSLFGSTWGQQRLTAS